MGLSIGTKAESLTSIDAISSSSIACLSASLGDKELFITLQIYILQLADVVRRIVAVLAMYLANSYPISSS